MKKQLFGGDAVEPIDAPEKLSHGLRVTGPLGRVAVGTMLAGAFALIALIALTDVPIKVSGQGVLLGDEDPPTLALTSSHGGRVEELLVEAGDRVEAGQTVARLGQEAMQQELEIARQELAATKDKLARAQGLQGEEGDRKDALRKKTRAAVRKAIRQLNRRLKSLRKQEKEQEDLKAKGWITAARLDRTKADAASAQEQLAARKRELLDLDADESQDGGPGDVADLESALAATERKIEGIEDNIARASVLVGTTAGTISRIDVAVGDLLQPEDPVVQLLPQGQGPAEDDPAAGRLRAIVYLPLSAGGKVRAGMDVLLDLSSVRRAEFGMVKGRVDEVSAVDASEIGIAQVLGDEAMVRRLAAAGARFAVIVRLTGSADTPSGYDWTFGEGPDFDIAPGTFVVGEITTERVRILSLVMPALKHLAGIDG